ncbi:MAG: hypothetical protein SF052_08685 [Bacteroidia bacterium]|nr:hypothetical protein [Bacteroidia bacterium]
MTHNPFQKTFTLVQHTPMIHFQADQAGATLRATDVKPKIDRYVWEELQNHHPDLWAKYAAVISKKYFPRPADGEQASPSGYRIHIYGEPEAYYVPTAYMKDDQKGEVQRAVERTNQGFLGKSSVAVISGTPYFANADKIKDNKWNEVRLAVMYRNLRLEVFSPVPDVVSLISAILPSVFARYNFGTRSSKGFGYFSVEGSGKDILRKRTPYHFTVRVNESKDELAFETLYQHISLIYSALRSGINVPQGGGRNQTGSNFYFKSLLFLYFRDKGIQWDKKSIKLHYYRDELNAQKGNAWVGSSKNDPIHFTGTPGLLVRDLLGLASSQTWGKTYRDDEISKTSVHPTRNGKTEELIERFASPIWFKPVRSADKKSFDVYIGANDVPGEYLGEPFAIKSKNDRSSGALTLTTPSTFDIKGYLRFALTKVDLSKHVEGKYHSKREYQTLKNIFDSIQNNLKK